MQHGFEQNGMGCTEQPIGSIKGEDGAVVQAHIGTDAKMTDKRPIIKIAVLEDDPAILDVICSILDSENYRPIRFDQGHKLVQALHRERFDLFVLDWNLPDISGLQVIEWIRNQIGKTPPVLILTSRIADEDVVTGLKAGADDYIGKPVNRQVLLARVEALLRRSQALGVERESSARAPYEFDISARRIWLRGTPIEITPKEFQLAAHLFRNVNIAVSRSYLLETLWGFSPSAATRTLDIHMSNLRRKLKLTPENGFVLTPVYGYGYRLEKVLTA